MKLNPLHYLYILLPLIIIFIIQACQYTNNNPKGEPIARVYNNYLYKSDLNKFFEHDLPAQDSTEIANAYIKKWIKNQLLVHKAKTELSPDRKDIQKEIQDFKTKLLIYKYEQHWLDINLDTNISQQEIQSYYNSYTSQFHLDQPIIKGWFMKVRKDAPQLSKIRGITSSEDSSALQSVENYGYKYASDYQNFTNNWMDLSTILQKIPHDISDFERFLKYNESLETQDTEYYYLLAIHDYKLSNSVAPLSYVKNEVKLILINKRKHKLINKLESNVYNEALSQDYVKIYNKSK